MDKKKWEYEDFEYDDFSYKDFQEPEEFKHDDFSYDKYKESSKVTQAGINLNNHLAKKPGEYQSQWQDQLDGLMNQIMNRDKFSYDMNGDALYQQYKDKYIQQGKMAMADTMGQAAAMTGGYGNSYAQSVGQQAYQGQLQNLNDVIPELYAMALDKYNREGQELYNRYGMVVDRDNTDYGRHRDSVGDWQSERDYLAGRYDTERDIDYSKYVDDRNFAYSQYADDRNFEYGKWSEDRAFDYNKYTADRGLAYDQYTSDRNLAYDQYSSDKKLSYDEYRNAIADEQWQKQFDESVRQHNENMTYKKEQDTLAQENWQKQFDADEAYRLWQQSQAELDRDESNARDYYETEGALGYNNGSLTPEQVKEMQEFLGTTTDGKWDGDMSELTGGMSAEDAYKAMQEGKLEPPVEPKESKNTAAFIDRFSRDQYVARGNDKDGWLDYVESGITSFLRSGRITEEEALYLIEYYGLS